MFDDIRGGCDVDAAIERYMADDFVEHEPVPGIGGSGRETPRQMFKMMQQLGAGADG